MAWISRITALFVGLPLWLCAFETQPWMYPPFEFQLKADYRFDFFSSVNHGFNPIDYHSNNNYLTAGLLVPILNYWDGEIEVQLNQTTKKSFGFLSVGAAVRKQILNDIEGDFISLTFGGNFRFVPNERLDDVATDYHHMANFEATSSIGKEFSNEKFWYARVFGFAALGQAERGYPWLRFLLEGMTQIDNRYIIKAFLKSYIGTGPDQWVDVRKFDSYASIAHRNIDIGMLYAYKFQVWGEASLSYAYRVYAYAYPEYTNTIQVNYRLPFSF